MPITSSFPPMFIQTSNVTNNLAVSLLTHYSFDLGGYNASELVKRWENQYPSNWVHLAIIEALYQGRYKAVSAQQILTLWLRRNHPSYHFNMEFERLICNKLPEDLRWNNSLPPLPPALPSVGNSNPTIEDVMRNYESSTSYRRNIQSEQATEKPVESASARAEEDCIARNPSKILPSSTSMVFVPRMQSETSITRSNGSRTLTQTRYIEKNSEFDKFKELKQLEESQQIEKPLVSEKIVKFLPPERNHPPIEQFTPEKSDSSDTFTSKLKGVMG
ncbi:hypothetical protein [Calothrix sp. CCY 0018]|uniref:hypothetical protein n=1 Tax=Calothrix sp. CCY 0018 TaxID=3103864 RepID=UPI0039C74FE1